MKKIFLALLILLALGLLALPRVLKNDRDDFAKNALPSDLPAADGTDNSVGAQKQRTLEINGIKVRIKIAKTAQEQTMGLGGRETLAQDEGILFLFNKPATQRFWMRGMKFPLDILWISNDEVRGITKNIPAPAPTDIFSESLPTYQSNEPADKVLEVNAGWAEANNIKIGDKIKIKN